MRSANMVQAALHRRYLCRRSPTRTSTETRKVEQAKAPTESGQSGTDSHKKEGSDGLQNKYVERIYYADPDKVDTITIDVSSKSTGPST
jgi:hypothetical protein